MPEIDIPRENFSRGVPRPESERISWVSTHVRKLPQKLLARHYVCVASDDAFQQRARLLQALWREARGLPIGEQRGVPLGSRIAPAFARTTGAAFLTPTIREVVAHALSEGRDPGQLVDVDRLYANLLSSQPLCFNLFAEASRDLALATRAFRTLAPTRIERVLAVEFERSPGRGDARFTGDRSAFDVFVTYVSPRGRRGFLGIEVKYHESLGDAAASHRDRYDEVAATMGCFVAERDALRSRPYQQIWRDHLLAGALVAAGVGFDEGAFVFLAPRDNGACARAVSGYRSHLTDEATFLALSLEDVHAALAPEGDATWHDAFFARYLDFARVERLAAG